MRALVLCDDRWHPAHIVRGGLEPLSAAQFQFDWVENPQGWPVASVFDYPVVVLAKSNNVSAIDESPWVTPSVESTLREYVSQGGGLLAVHSGTAGYAETPILRGLLGGVFLQHPQQCPVTVEPRNAHLLAKEIEPFTIEDEHYFVQMDDAGADVFLTTTSAHGVQPGGWTRSEGRGRICVITPGHNLEVWLHPQFQALLKNALRWCGTAG